MGIVEFFFRGKYVASGDLFERRQLLDVGKRFQIAPRAIGRAREFEVESDNAGKYVFAEHPADKRGARRSAVEVPFADLRGSLIVVVRRDVFIASSPAAAAGRAMLSSPASRADAKQCDDAHHRAQADLETTTSSGRRGPPAEAGVARRELSGPLPSNQVLGTIILGISHCQRRSNRRRPGNRERSWLSIVRQYLPNLGLAVILHFRAGKAHAHQFL